MPMIDLEQAIAVLRNLALPQTTAPVPTSAPVPPPTVSEPPAAYADMASMTLADLAYIYARGIMYRIVVQRDLFLDLGFPPHQVHLAVNQGEVAYNNGGYRNIEATYEGPWRAPIDALCAKYSR